MEYCSLNGVGQMKTLKRELGRYRWDVIGLAETQRENSGEITIDVGHIITFYGKEKYHQHGVAFILRKYLNTAIINYTKVHNKVKD